MTDPNDDRFDRFVMRLLPWVCAAGIVSIIWQLLEASLY